MELDGMVPWKTTFLYKQGGELHFHVMCSSERGSRMNPILSLHLLQSSEITTLTTRSHTIGLEVPLLMRSPLNLPSNPATRTTPPTNHLQPPKTRRFAGTLGRQTDLSLGGSGHWLSTAAMSPSSSDFTKSAAPTWARYGDEAPKHEHRSGTGWVLEPLEKHGSVT